MVYGPVLQHLISLDSLSESNKSIRSFIIRSMKNEIPATEVSQLQYMIPDSGLPCQSSPSSPTYVTLLCLMLKLWRCLKPEASASSSRTATIPTEESSISFGIDSLSIETNYLLRVFKEEVSIHRTFRNGVELMRALELPKDVFQVDTKRSVEILGMNYRTLEACIVDTIKSFQAVESRNK